MNTTALEHKRKHKRRWLAGRKADGEAFPTTEYGLPLIVSISVD
jgi:hypothetical protein